MNVAPYERFEVVGRYALYGVIASGGMATVHFGRLLDKPGTPRPVAVKRLRPHVVRGTHARATFIEEARRAACIRHPNVVPTLDVVATDGQLLVVMEYVHGETLDQLARAARERRQRIPRGVVLAIMTDVLYGLFAAHETNAENGAPMTIVHGDVTPKNIIVGVDGSARVLDFGISRAAVADESLDEGGVNGKLAYMSPEQLAEAPLTYAADVYAAAVVMWELLAGRRLFVRDDRAPNVLLEKLMHGPIEPPSTYDRSIPTALDDIVLRALARKPGQRFPSARAMANAIGALDELASASEVGDWVKRLAPEAIRTRSIAVDQITQPATQTRPRYVSAYDVDVVVEEPVEAAPLSVDPPPMIAASDTYPVTDPRTLLFLRTPSNLPIIIRPKARRIPWRTLAGVVFAAATGLAGGEIVTWSLAHNATPQAAAGRAIVVVAPKPAPVAAPKTMACGDGMVGVAGGPFVMGTDDGLAFERPAHTVRVAPFCIDRYETTAERYRACVDAGACKRAAMSNEWSAITDRDRRAFDPLCNARDPVGRASHPINCVDWEMASQACKSRGARLPTEAEWELAARGPDGRKYPWGSGEPSALLLNACGRECVGWGKKSGVDFTAMFDGDDGFATTAPVGSFPAGASRYGVEDLVGNVSEWVADYYGDYSRGGRENPTGPETGTERVIRGGAWNGSLSAWARPTFRTKDAPSKRSYAIGFRCAVAPLDR